MRTFLDKYFDDIEKLSSKVFSVNESNCNCMQGTCGPEFCGPETDTNSTSEEKTQINNLTKKP